MGFTCQMIMSTTYENCTINPSTGYFTRIGIFISNDRVDHASFVIRDDTLKVGDVVTLFGNANAPHDTALLYPHESYFFWLGGLKVSILSDIGQFPLFLPASSVSFSLE